MKGQYLGGSNNGTCIIVKTNPDNANEAALWFFNSGIWIQVSDYVQLSDSGRGRIITANLLSKLKVAFHPERIPVLKRNRATENLYGWQKSLMRQ